MRAQLVYDMNRRLDDDRFLRKENGVTLLNNKYHNLTTHKLASLALMLD